MATKEFTDEQVLSRVRQFVANNRPFKKAAGLLGISETMLRDVLNGNRAIGTKIPSALGLTVRRVYQETART